jgi:hypothetical protein
MKTWYQNKADFHHKEWQIAQENNKEKAAAHHMAEFINYQEMAEQVKDSLLTNEV